MSVSPQIPTLKPNAQCHGIRRGGPWETISPAEWNSHERDYCSLQLGPYQALWYLPSGEVTAQRAAWPPSRHWIYQHHDLGLPAFGPVRNKCLSCISHPVSEFLLQQPRKTEAPQECCEPGSRLLSPPTVGSPQAVGETSNSVSDHGTSLMHSVPTVLLGIQIPSPYTGLWGPSPEALSPVRFKAAS